MFDLDVMDAKSSWYLFTILILFVSAWLLVLPVQEAFAATGNQKCAAPRNLCPDPGLCFASRGAQDTWATKHSCRFISTAMLDAADPGGSSTRPASIVGYINKYAREYSVNTPSRMAHFLSQIGYESGFRATTESLNYSSKRMRQIFGCKGGARNYDVAKDDCMHGRLRGKLWTKESTYTHHSKNLGSYVYANKLGNGDEASGDGYKYRGRGLIQLTGKANYKAFQNKHNKLDPKDKQSFIKDPGLLASNKKYAVESAFYFWSANHINAVADNGTVKSVTKKVNGGYNGLAERKKLYNSLACMLGAKQES